MNGDSEQEFWAWVLWYRYGDGSGAGVLRVYLDKDRAVEEHELIKDEQTGKIYELSQTKIYGELPY